MFIRVWNKIGSKDLRDIFKYYPIKKGDVLRVGDNIQLTVKNENEFEDFVGDVCLLCKFKYPESVEFVNLDCKHCWACRVCRNTDILCPVCSEQIKNWEAVSNVVSFDEN